MEEAEVEEEEASEPGEEAEVDSTHTETVPDLWSQLFSAIP